MSSGSRSSLLRQFRTLFEAGTVAGLTDGQLLERFLAGPDDGGEVAFEALVARHGPMVLGVCRRALVDPNDAADAFQATFLVLVRKARSIRVDDSLGRWLYGVSRRVASRARASAARRPRSVDGEIDAIEARSTDPDRFELASLLDEELARLPESFRSALVLCDLEGLTHEEAARDLRCPVGTIKSRLSRGRERLRVRLTRRGLSPFSMMIAPIVPALLAESAVRASMLSVVSVKSAAEVVSASAVAIAEGVLKSMNGIMLKLAASALFSIGVVATGAGVLAQVQRDETESADIQATKADEPSKGRVKGAPLSDRMEAKLKSPVTVNFKNHPLERAIQDLSSYTGVNIILDPVKITEAEVRPDTPVTLTAKEITLRAALKSMLRPLQLNYQVVDDVVIVTATGPSDTRETMSRAQFQSELGKLRQQLDRAIKLGGNSSDPAIVLGWKQIVTLEYELAKMNKALRKGDKEDPTPPKAERAPNPGRKILPGPGQGVEPPREGEKVSMPEYVVEPPDIIIVEVLEALPGRPITGEHLVRPDGKISLGFYGEVYVAGLTTTEIKAKVALHLRDYIKDEKLGLTTVDVETGRVKSIAPSRTNRIYVDVTAYNSKYYYVQGDVGVPGRLQITGNETVLDAINLAGGLVPTASKNRVRLVRPSPPDSDKETTLSVDLDAIINQGQTKTNFQLLPGDRLIVDRDPKVAIEAAKAANLERPSPSDVEARLQTVERKLDEVLKALERLPKP
jgi:RNA polymerase sigma factor (sigma-70 family)